MWTWVQSKNLVQWWPEPVGKWHKDQLKCMYELRRKSERHICIYIYICVCVCVCVHTYIRMCAPPEALKYSLRLL